MAHKISYEHTVIYNGAEFKARGIYFLTDNRVLVEDKFGTITAFDKHDVIIIFPYIINGKQKIIRYGQEEFINERNRNQQIHQFNTETQTRSHWGAIRQSWLAFRRKAHQWYK